jgi:transcriptional regulator with XRE-family HTH domain
MKINTKKMERARILRGWTKARLADEIGIDPSTIGKIERGKNFKPPTIKKIADALGLDMESLLLDDAV